VAKNLARAGVDGCFYWFDNNWHYIRQWDHLKELRTPARTFARLLDHCPDYWGVKLPESDRIMSRTISMLIKVSWTHEDLSERIKKINSVL